MIKNRGWLRIQKPVPVPWVRKRALVEFSEQAIPISRNEIVERVPDETRHRAEQCCDEFPDTAKAAQQQDRRFRARAEALARFFGIGHDIESVEVVGGDAVTGEDPGRNRSLQCRKTELILPVASQGELDESIAKSADAVIEDDGVIGGIQG